MTTPTQAPANSAPQPEMTTRKVSNRGRKPGQKAKERATIPADEMVVERVPADERAASRRQRGERSAQQRAYDKLVDDVRAEWRQVGKPSDWNQMPVMRLKLSKQYVEDALFYLGKAAGYANAKLIKGHITDRDKLGKRFEDGKFRIPFCVVDRNTNVENAPSESE